MASSLFHIDRDGSLNPLREAAYASDEELQSLVTHHPALLGGDPEGQGGWFSIARVGPAPDGAARSPRWSVEHLFLARDGAPTVVETMRAGDTRAHGDLFGQILYYAANAAAWWPGDVLRGAFADTHARPGYDAAVALAGFIGANASPDAFWGQAEANLAAGKVRMVLVIDEVQPDLARMVDFLNSQLRDAEVWILQIRQFVGPGGSLIESSVLGRRGEAPAAEAKTTTTAVSARPSPASRAASRPMAAGSSVNAMAASREAFVSSLRAQCDVEENAVLDDLLRWMGEQYGATSISDAPTPAFRLSVKEGGKDRFPFGVTQTKTAAIHLGSLSTTRAYEADEARRGLIHEIAQAGLPVSDVDLKGDLLIPLTALAAPALRTRVLAVLDGVIETLRLKEAPSAFLS